MKNIREVSHIKDTIFLFGKQPVKNDVDQGGGAARAAKPGPYNIRERNQCRGKPGPYSTN
jgi:hypothetical protein